MLNVLTANDSWYTSLHLTGDNRFVKKNYRSICKKMVPYIVMVLWCS